MPLLPSERHRTQRAGQRCRWFRCDVGELLSGEGAAGDYSASAMRRLHWSPSTVHPGTLTLNQDFVLPPERSARRADERGDHGRVLRDHALDAGAGRALDYPSRCLRSVKPGNLHLEP
jgi:hypothetical protein